METLGTNEQLRLGMFPNKQVRRIYNVNSTVV